MQRLHPSACARCGAPASRGLGGTPAPTPLRCVRRRSVSRAPAKKPAKQAPSSRWRPGCSAADHGELSGEEGARRGAWSRSMLGGRILSRQGMEARALWCHVTNRHGPCVRGDGRNDVAPHTCRCAAATPELAHRTHAHMQPMPMPIAHAHATRVRASHAHVHVVGP